MDELRMAFERDDPFTMGEEKCFFNIETHSVFWAGGDLSSVQPVGKKWVIVPGTPHGEWHDVFMEWLKEIGKSEYYTTSIGLTLKKLDQVDEGLRHGWYVKKYEYSEQKAKEWLKQHSHTKAD